MYLVNALTFEAEWTKIYERDQVKDATFTKEDGREQDIKLMYSTEGRYLEDELACGFISIIAAINTLLRHSFRMRGSPLMNTLLLLTERR